MLAPAHRTLVRPASTDGGLPGTESVIREDMPACYTRLDRLATLQRACGLHAPGLTPPTSQTDIPMKLVGSQGSPFARKVRVVMAEKKIDCQFDSINVAESHAQTLQFNPLGKVPYLILDDNEVLFDSRVIVEYLDNLTPVHRLIPASGRERAEVKVWEALADGMLDAVGLVRLESMRPESQRSDAWVAKQQTKVDAALASLSQRLGDQPFCVDGKYSLADIAVGCALGYVQWRAPHLNWREQYPNLGAHADKLFARASFADTQPPPA